MINPYQSPPDQRGRRSARLDGMALLSIGMMVINALFVAVML